MACDLDDREETPLRQMEPRLGRMFHSSATGRRRSENFPDPHTPCQEFDASDIAPCPSPHCAAQEALKITARPLKIIRDAGAAPMHETASDG